MLRLLDELGLKFSPWHEVERIQSELNRLIPESVAGASANRAPVNIYAGSEGAKVVAKLPGWNPSWIDLAVDGNKLQIRGDLPKDVEPSYPEMSAFSRLVTLPYRIQAEGVTASYRDGLLVVELPRHEQEKPRKIDIKVA